MITQAVKKLLSLIPTMFIASIILFVLISVLPGDAVTSMLSESTTAESEQHMRESLGLADPLYIQYFRWIEQLFHGNLGVSLVSKTSVAQGLMDRFPVTMELVLLAALIGTVVAVPAGIICAVKRGTAMDNISSVAAIIGVSIPSFWLATICVLLFSVHWGILPASGFVSLRESVLGNLRYMIIPAFCTGTFFAGSMMRQTRSALMEVLNQEYILTAQAKGLRDWIVIWKHALRNAIIPVITVLAMQIGRLIGGTVVIETIFGLPGMGKAIINGIFQRDYTLVMGFVIVIIAFVVCLNTFVDIMYVVVDPRLSRTKAK
jgi:peptide/nickel transport system permease protein